MFDSVLIGWTTSPIPSKFDPRYWNKDAKYRDYNLSVKDKYYSILSFDAEIIHKSYRFHYKETIYGNRFTQKFKEKMRRAAFVPYARHANLDLETNCMLKFSNILFRDANGNTHKGKDLMWGFK